MCFQYSQYSQYFYELAKNSLFNTITNVQFMIKVNNIYLFLVYLTLLQIY